MTVIKHNWNDVLISQRKDDSYVCLTDMAKACDRRVNDYVRLDSTQEYLKAISVDAGIPVSDLLLSVKSSTDQRTWAHPEIAIDFAQWVSVPFRIWANRTLKSVIDGTVQNTASIQIKPEHIQAYQFDTEEFQPFKDKCPDGAKVFLSWYVEQIETNSIALPSDATQKALNSAFLNLNRSGLAMNKLFHWIDRYPAMQKIDSEGFTDMQKALLEAMQTIAKLQEQLKTAKHNKDRDDSTVLFCENITLKEKLDLERKRSKDLQQMIDELTTQLATVSQAETKQETAIEIVPETAIIKTKSVIATAAANASQTEKKAKSKRRSKPSAILPLGDYLQLPPGQ